MSRLGLVVCIISVILFFVFYFKKREWLGLYILGVFLFLPKINILTLNNDISSPGLRSEDFLILLFMIITLFEKFKYSREIFKSKIFIIYCLYLASCTISLVCGYIFNYTHFVVYSLFSYIRKIEYFCFIFVGYDIYRSFKELNNKNCYSSLLRLLNIFTIFSLVLCIFQRIGIVPAFRYGSLDLASASVRAFGTFNGPYELSQFFTIMICVYFYKILKINKTKNENIVNILLIACSLLIIVLSESRTCIIISPLICLLMLFVYAKKKTKIITISILPICIILVILCINAVPFFDRFNTLNLSDILESIKYNWNNSNPEAYYPHGDMSLNLRLSKWFAVINLWLKTPIFGYGFGSSKTIDGSFLRVLCESGIVGLALFMTVLIYIIRSCKHKNSKYIIWTTISLLFGAVLIDIFDASKIMEFFWLLVGLNCINTETSKNSLEIIGKPQLDVDKKS